jgi:uncharacterized coiled-coil protein SlyX
LDTGDSVGEVARLCKIDASLLRRCRWDYEKEPELAFPGSRRHPLETGIAELRRQIERHAQEINHLMERIQSAEAQSVSGQVNNGANHLVAKQHG